MTENNAAPGRTTNPVPSYITTMMDKTQNRLDRALQSPHVGRRTVLSPAMLQNQRRDFPMMHGGELLLDLHPDGSCFVESENKRRF